MHIASLLTSSVSVDCPKIERFPIVLAISFIGVIGWCGGSLSVQAAGLPTPGFHDRAEWHVCRKKTATPTHEFQPFRQPLIAAMATFGVFPQECAVAAAPSSGVGCKRLRFYQMFPRRTQFLPGCDTLQLPRLSLSSRTTVLHVPFLCSYPIDSVNY